MTVAVRPSLRLLALVPTLVAVGSVVVDVVLFEYFGAFLLAVLSQLVYVGVGLLLTLRLPRHPVGWLLLWAGALFQLTFACGAYAWAAFIRWPGTLPPGEVALVLIGYAWIPALGCLFLAIMLFPTGRPPSPRWRVPVAVVVLKNALELVAAPLTTREFQVSQSVIPAQGALPLTVANPLAIDGPLETLLGYLYGASSFAYVVYLIPVAAVLVRFRTAAGTERQQLKWFAYASSIVVLFLASAFVVPVFSYLGGLLPFVVLDLVPISIAIAILRYRLYDIDLLINRTVVYGVTSAAIAVTFFLGLVALQAALRPGSELAVAASTLVSFALFQPIRRRVQGAVDRRFDRRRYDAERTLDAFAARLRDQVDLGALEGELLEAVRETVQPAHASVWLRGRAP